MKLIAALFAFSLFTPLNFTCSRQDKTQGPLLSYEYFYNGPMGRSGVYYKVEKGDDGIRITFSDQGSWAEKKAFPGPDDALEVIGRMVAEGDLQKLKKDYKTRFDVRDGWDWTLHIRYESGGISSGGYMAKPNQARWDAIQGINAYIDSLIKKP